MDNVLDYLKDGYIVIPKILLLNYRKLNITEEELVLLIFMISDKEKILYDPTIFVDMTGLDNYKVMTLINSLSDKKIISIEVIKNKIGKMEEYINLDLLYNKLLGIIVDKKTEDESNIYETFEREFGRTLSPMEYSIINGWINDQFSEELLLEALKEATYNGVSNFRYIDKILYEWKKKGIKSSNDVMKEKQTHRKKKSDNVNVFDYDWLDEN